MARIAGITAGGTLSLAAGSAGMVAAVKQQSPRKRNRMIPTTLGTQIGVGAAVFLGARFLRGATKDVARGVGLGIGGAAAPTLFALPIADRLLVEHDPTEGARMVALAQGHIDTARQWFAQRGVAQHQGLGPIEVRYERAFFNAGYKPAVTGDREKYIVVGRDLDTGRPYADVDDVLYHEFAHRVIEHIAPNINEGPRNSEAGAVSEAIADTFAVAIDDGDWTFAELAGTRLQRNLADPHALDVPAGRYKGRPYPATRAEYLRGGDIHFNATIPGHAAYRVASALGRDAMAAIWLHALRTHGDGPPLDIAGLGQATVTAARALHGEGSRELAAVRDAWRGIGYEVE